jgi:hypothetical protein
MTAGQATVNLGKREMAERAAGLEETGCAGLKLAISANSSTSLAAAAISQ